MLVAVGSATVLLLTARGTVLALGLIATATALAGARLVARVRLRASADRTADRVVEACEALAGELRAGQPPSAALSHCAEVWPALEPVVAADGLGSDVPQALRRLAGSPGAAGLREVASAWQVSVGSGAAMSSALTLVADSARERRATQRLVQAELASAQATARLVAVLPVVALVDGGRRRRRPVGVPAAHPGGSRLPGRGARPRLRRPLVDRAHRDRGGGPVSPACGAGRAGGRRRGGPGPPAARRPGHPEGGSRGTRRAVEPAAGRSRRTRCAGSGRR